MQLKVSPISRQECSAAEWQARVDLAAAHRIAVMHGFNEGIFNHLTLAVPGQADRYYQIPFGMHWSEVKASSFMEVGIDDGKVKRGAGDVERSCLLHPRADPQGAAADRRRRVPHPHALRQRADAARGPAHQGDRPDRGRHDGRDRLRRRLHGPRLRPRRGRAARQDHRRQERPVHGQPRHHHGRRDRRRRPTTGSTTSSAPRRCRSTPCGPASRSKQLPEPVVEKTSSEIGGASFYDGPTPPERHFDALKRILDRKEPDYVE